mmetsp:Transcript_49349/g.155183  ORF Transcript_49349/g.155183 Transcript_49349/m.155183 type:complete len:384 (-) Transcript_49349:113-1264(-)
MAPKWCGYSTTVASASASMAARRLDSAVVPVPTAAMPANGPADAITRMKWWPSHSGWHPSRSDSTYQASSSSATMPLRSQPTMLATILSASSRRSSHTLPTRWRQSCRYPTTPSGIHAVLDGARQVLSASGALRHLRLPAEELEAAPGVRCSEASRAAAPGAFWHCGGLHAAGASGNLCTQAPSKDSSSFAPELGRGALACEAWPSSGSGHCTATGSRCTSPRRRGGSGPDAGGPAGPSAPPIGGDVAAAGLLGAEGSGVGGSCSASAREPAASQASGRPSATDARRVGGGTAGGVGARATVRWDCNQGSSGTGGKAGQATRCRRDRSWSATLSDDSAAIPAGTIEPPARRAPSLLRAEAAGPSAINFSSTSSSEPVSRAAIT